MFIIKYYVIAALLCLSVALFSPFWPVNVLFFWGAISLTLVSLAYLFDMPSIFRKRQDGKIVWWIRWAFIPFLAGVRVYNHWAIRNDKVEPIQKVSDNLFLSRRLFNNDSDFLQSNDITCIVDVTAEFAGLESAMADKQFNYLTIPVLDHKAPSMRRLRHALNWIDTQISSSRSVVVHCALGRGRSVFVVTAYLLSKDPSLTVDEALKRVNDVRNTARLNKTQLKALNAIHNKKLLKLPQPVWMIANPVSGGGKWKEHEASLIYEITKQYRLRVLLTTSSVSAKSLTQKAIENNAEFIVACGGDGTVTEVAGELVESDIKLGIVPLGTANALCHVLYGVSTKFDPVSVASEAITSGNSKKIDTAECNGQLCLLVIGIGFEQQMIDYAHRKQKDLMGQFAYLTGFFNAVMSDSNQTFDIVIDQDERFSIDAHSLVIANTAPFSTLLAQGGSAPKEDDGKLHITYLDNSETVGERLVALSDLTLSSVGLQEQSTLFSYTTAEQIEISSSEQIDYVIDGELYSADKLAIKIKQHSLNVCVP